MEVRVTLATGPARENLVLEDPEIGHIQSSTYR
jgi:hypothetical protein